MFDDDYDDYDPTEPFSQDEFVTHNNRELRNLDVGRAENDDYDEADCPHCGCVVTVDPDDDFAHCPNCNREFPMD